CVLLVDTYNVIKSGIPNAIKVFDEVLKPLGKKPIAVRIDSGDIAYLSKKARIMLDSAGYSEVKIVASNALDEYIIRDLFISDAKLDSFGVGENLITSRTTPVLGGVYKLVAVKKAGEYIPKIKVSESFEKITIPYRKQVYRIYSKDTGKALADYLAIFDEQVEDKNEITIFSPLEPWKKVTLENVFIKPLLIPIFIQGKRVYDSPCLTEIRDFCTEQLDTLWDEVKRLEYPHQYYVDYSKRLWDEQRRLLEEI
ncbi:MAG: nicotinate phosphoribosyltransferase, partial [Oscillospiraceae bacterium]